MTMTSKTSQSKVSKAHPLPSFPGSVLDLVLATSFICVKLLRALRAQLKLSEGVVIV